MNTFIITEKQNTNSRRVKIKAKNLAAAKRTAIRYQVFVSTVLTIENESGDIIAVKEGKAWSDNPAADYMP